ncbi:MAG: T9SS type A sorting domain-containing protein, partial [Muribaculaceae bacterium]
GGKPRKIESYALDPTHPGTKKMIELQINKFKTLGYKYVKIDFVNNGALEADSYYDKNVTTGMQAYTAGLKHFNETVGGDMFINLSIAPVFPAQYTHGRRISCDAWGAVNQSQYVLNSMNLSWWLEQVYSFNDPDHIVYMRNDSFNYVDAWSEGANRIRTTTGLMCGTMVLGDNFSLKGTAVGTQKARDKAIKYMANEDILAVARIGKMFRPVEGSLNTGFSLYQRMNVDKYFTLDTKDTLYLVVFNYASDATTESLVFERIGIETGNVKEIKELWTGEMVLANGDEIDCKVPAEDVRVYRISKEKSGINNITKNDDEALRLNIKDGSLEIYSPSPISSANIYSTMGQLQLSQNYNATECNEKLDVSTLSSGLYITSIKLATGSVVGEKFIK